MDLTLLSAPVSDYNKQRTGAHFTVRSANSPSYSLTRRPGIRKSRTLCQEDREDTEEVGNRDRHGTNGASKEDRSASGCQSRTSGYSSVRRQSEEREMSDHRLSTKMNHNGIAGKTSTESGTDRSVNFASESRGRTEWRRSNLTSRSKSLDWRAGGRSPERCTRTDMLSRKPGEDVSKQVRGNDSVRSRVMSTVQAYNSAGTSTDSDQTLDRASRGHSLPSKLRSQSKEVAASFGPKGGQSILERIEKLFGSSGLSKTEDHSKTRHLSGGTFPRRFSSERETYNLSPGQTRESFSWLSPKDPISADSDALFSPGTSKTRVTSGSGGGQWQRPISGRHFDEGSVYQGRGWEELGTRSLDRARSKYTIAAKIRAARAAEESAPPAHSHTFLKELSEVSDKHQFASRPQGQNGSKEKDGTNNEERESETDGLSGVLKERNPIKMDQIKEQKQEKMTEGELKEEKKRKDTDLKRSRTDEEDVFETNPLKIRLKTVEKKSFTNKSSAPSAANVRNKINQFEALTQRAQGLTTGQVLIPRRTFSVPTHLSRAYDGVKKSGSAKAIGGLKDKWEGLREREEDKMSNTHKKFGFERVLQETKTENPDQSKEVQRGLNLRSMSVDEAGLRLTNKERRGTDVADKEEKNVNTGNKCSEDLGKYSRLKETLDIPLHGGSQTQNSVKFYVDETDFSKVSSPKEVKQKLTTDSTTSSLLSDCGDTSTGMLQRSEPSEPSGLQNTPVSDDEKTPTNTPDNSPFLSPDPQPQMSSPFGENENEDSSVFIQEAKPLDSESTPTPLATSSYITLPDLISPDSNQVLPKGKKRVLDLDAWVAGLNPQIKGWEDDEDDDDDDDDDESTQKDDDSNYDSDSGESSVTITSNMSQSDHKSFSVSLADLCNFAGMDYESETDSDEWQSTGRRSASLSSDVSALSYVSVMPSEELDRLIDDVKGLGDNALQGCEDVQVVVLHKDVGVGLGFSMAGGVDQNKPVTVHKVFHSGVAAQEGSIREGDQVLSINGTALGGYAHWEALRVLRRAKSREMGVVVLKRGGITTVSKGSVLTNNQEPTPTEDTETGECVCVQLEKNNRDLGFSLEGGVGSSMGNKPLSVQKIFQGGPVDKVCPGDEVLEIEGLSVVGMRRLEAWTLIRKLPPGPVNVVLRRSSKHPNT
ncbi:uncharacterized protein LOC115435247 isoform X2 [Sphaeramia orbicularis]|uniref:Uncharacterized LOC115435247 n=1 Tax=Sphaeramia orbicularis TaxID=375764 RepID=A0A672Z0J1_9TELE|nr:uncharacterized protein LOC115435247 isoform X1 [Sphaeramia orbicularis]XP_030013388.1 uncharacterized protein LOC115435247 isoform X1 [Sphaeramia orbicularis]XP_030013389.1 uncharacterized protein LOC115435247 isoform X2 [Sphaeramia orbicularis]